MPQREPLLPTHLPGPESTQTNGTTLPKTKPNGAAASTSNVLSTTIAETSAKANAPTSEMEPATATATQTGNQQDNSNNGQPAYNQPSKPSQSSLVPSTTSLQQFEPQQSNGARDAVVDNEASPQASQNEEHFVIMGIVGFVPDMELQDGWRTTTWRKRPRMFGTQPKLNAACAVASQVAGLAIVPGGPNQYVRNEHLTVFIVHTVSGLVGSRLGVTDNLVHIQYTRDNVQDTNLTPSFADSTEVNNFGLRLHGPNPGAEHFVSDPGFNPAYMPPLPPRSTSPWTTSSATR